MTDLLETIAASLILTNGVVLYASVSSRDNLLLGVLISASVAHGFSGTISFCIKFTGSCHINMYIWKAEGFADQAEPWEFRNEEYNWGLALYHAGHISPWLASLCLGSLQR